MKAAVVHEYGQVPRYEEIEAPAAATDREELVDMLAAGLHPRVRSQAAGSHYTSTDELPLIPGVDGVGRRADGSLVYFLLPDTRYGTMAEQTVIDPRRSVPLPADADAVLIAAAMNPGMSAWIALKQRIKFSAGQSVLILGATGSSGQLAIQIAKRLGAGRVIAAGRDPEKLATLPALGADATIDLRAEPEALARDIAEKASEVDVVLDYLWGAPTEFAMNALVLARKEPARLLTWIEIGSVGGPDIALPSALLRQANLRLLGSGQGSASAAGILSVLPSLVEEILHGGLRVEATTVPLRDVEAEWTATGGASERVVITP